jgi:hypothetical protein
MGSGSYTGGHSKVFISDAGTTWEVPDGPTKKPDDSSRDRWDNDIGVEIGRKISKQCRSFLSMCAMAFQRDELSETNPKPPPVLLREINVARRQ